MKMNQVREALDYVLANRFIGAGVIVFLSIVAMMVVDFIICRVLRVMARRTSTDFDDSFIDYIHQPIRTSVLLIGLYLAAHHIELESRLISISGSFLKSLAVLIWAIFAIRFSGLIFSYLSRIDKVSVIQPRTQLLFDNLVKVVLFGLGIYFIFIFWDIDLSAWLASAGIIGIAVGFAAKDTLANLLGGIAILADAPYKVGDYINLDSGERGEVTQIGLRSTRLLTRDDVEVTIPNSVTAGAKIVNETGGRWEKMRIRIKVSVAYRSDIDHLRELLIDIAARHPWTCQEPEPRVRFRAFGDSSLDFELLCWIDEPVLRGRVIDALNSEIYKKLAAEGIEIPYPKRDIYIREMPERKLD
jgi:MscS family membrane protein